ncbi:MAG: hydrolase [Bacilli bacterium]|nr:hydrolase [Bacilli bacterium]
MDTSSHLLFGITLVGLAYLDPAVSANPDVAHALIAASLLGSNAPDFDAVTRFKGYACYVRHHRGLTHSLPALFIWPAVISLPIALLSGVMNHLTTLYFWTFIAVAFHVLLDLFNAYGVQCFRPISNKWVHLDTLSLYEPFLFMIHLISVMLWIFTPISPQWIFSSLYSATFLFILIRWFNHQSVVKRITTTLNIDGLCQVVPSLHWFRWQFVVETEDFFYTGKTHYTKITLLDRYPKAYSSDVIEATKATDGVRAFLHFAQKVHVSFTKKQDGYEVKWRDVRFWYNHKLPFGVDVQLDQNLSVTSSTIGWSKKSWDPPYV